MLIPCTCHGYHTNRLNVIFFILVKSTCILIKTLEFLFFLREKLLICIPD